MIIVWCEIWRRTLDNKHSNFVRSSYCVVNTDNCYYAEDRVKEALNIHYPYQLVTMTIRPCEVLE